MWIVDGEEPICDECDEARQPLLAEIERLKAELAKFHKCDDSNGCCDEFGSVHIVDATDNSFVYDYRGETMRAVYHKVDE
jgi:hypothetical protein